MEIKGKKIEGILYRECRLLRQAVDEQSRSVELSFSSSEPYDMGRYGGVEILGHDQSEVNMERLEQGTHPLLLQHDPNQQIGVIERAWIDQETQRGKAKVRFAPPTNKLAEEVYQDVLAGIRSLISVGYLPEEKRAITEDDEGGEELLAKFKGKDVYRTTRWTPMEISIVSIPVDYKKVGIGKEQKVEEPSGEPEEETSETKNEPEPEPEKIPEPEPAIHIRNHMAEKLTDKDKERIALEEKQAADRAEAEAKQREEKLALIARQADSRIKEIYAIASRWGAESLKDQAIAENWPVDRFRATVMDSMDSGMVIKHAHTETANEGKSIGQIFVDSPTYKERGGAVGQQRTISLEVPRETFTGTRATLNATDYSLTAIQKQPGVPGLLDQQMINVAQLFAQGTTSGLTVRYLQEDSFTQVAARVAEEGTYAAASLPVSEVDATVHKVGVYLKTTDEMLADFEGIRSFIDGRLAYMVGIKEDDYLLNGTGTNQIKGILQVTGINTVDRGTYDTVADTIGQALNKVRTQGQIDPDTVILNPNDWTNLILSKDDNKQYLAGGPFTGAYGQGGYSNVGQMFGLPVVTTTMIAQGTGLVGSFRMGAQLFRRAGITVEASNAEASYFINGSVAIRAQSRMTLATYKPLAFCSITSIA